MPYGIVLSDSITDSSGGVLAPSSSVFRNRIINGAMQIDQRNAGASVTPTADPTYTLDRWRARISVASKFSVQQNAASVTPPVGYSKYLGITSLSAYSIGSSDYFGIEQIIEGQNISDLAWGTASAAPITLSFWVRSSLTGTFGGALRNSAGDRNYPFTYTINAANTWEKETITIAGDTSGTWLTTNGGGIYVVFGLGVGSTFSGTAGAWSATAYLSATGATSVVGTNGATFYITGVQLEKGSTATSFDYRPYGTELALCQRYLPAWNSTGTVNVIAPAYANTTTQGISIVTFPVAARVPPTGVTVSSSSHFTNQFGGTNLVASAVALASGFNQGVTQASIATAITGATAGASGMLYFNNSSGQLLFTGCEL